MMASGELTVSSIAQDALSEISESSRDEIREMFGPDVYQQRFRIDRAKLERMIQDGDGSAEIFFQRIMDNTNTYISWPHRLKVGAKSKKDPHVRIAGLPENVQAARQRVLDVLDTKSDRVNMKLDVSYTDHSHIIGKGGLTIKRVMESTGCHIHFPDSNRSSTTEKSNQVSIAGTLEGVEKARSNIRRLMPLIFSFELPVTGSLQPMPDAQSPEVQRVCQQYNVEVMFRQRFKLHSTLVLVKGCDWEAERVKHATLILIHYMCGEIHAGQVAVEMSLEISPQHHSVVLGRHSSNLKVIMQQTGTRILFPDAEDPNIPPLKKSNIRITGHIDKVYLARQHLIGSLPLIVMFELESGVSDEYEDRVSTLMHTLDVNIKMRQKPRQSTLSVLIKGVEKDAGNIYIACQKLLNLDGPTINADIPSSYHIPNLRDSLFSNNNNNNEFRDLCSGIRQLACNPGLMSPVYSPQSPHGLPWLQNSTYWPQQQVQPQRIIHQGMLMPQLTTVPRIVVPQHTYQPMFPSPDSAIHSASISSLSSPSLSPRQSSSSSPTHGICSSGAAIDLAAMLSGMSDRRAPGCERKTLEKAISLSPPDIKKIQAYKAMQTKPVASEMRVPTSQWSGAGLSISTPDNQLRGSLNQNTEDQMSQRSAWSGSPPTGPDSTSILNASNYLDSVPQRTMHALQEYGMPEDLGTLLLQHGLERYNRLFRSHEIDLNTFLTLSESDLMMLGVEKFGPRRKMVTIITDLKDRQQRDSCSGGSPHYDPHWN